MIRKLTVGTFCCLLLACGDGTNTVCDGADTCQAGACIENLAEVGTECGDQDTDTACNGTDSCDGNGACQDSHAVANTPVR